MTMPPDSSLRKPLELGGTMTRSNPFDRTIETTRRRTGMIVVVALLAVAAAPRPALAQPAPSDTWQLEIAPFYFWAAQLSGDMTVRNTTVPISVSFADAAKHLAGVFSFHVTARRHRIGVISDVMFMRFSTDAPFTLSNVIVVPGTVKLSNTIFEIGGSYLVVPAKELSLIGGVRTYTVGPTIAFTGATITVTPVDTSKTVVDGFVGFNFSPKLGEKVTLLSRADIGGGGSKMSWSTLIGVEYRFKPWGGLAFGYKAFGIDLTNDSVEAVPTKYDVKQYGPIFGINLHWSGQ